MQDIRQTANEVKVFDCFRPGDVVRSKVSLSYLRSFHHTDSLMAGLVVGRFEVVLSVDGGEFARSAVCGIGNDGECIAGGELGEYGRSGRRRERIAESRWPGIVASSIHFRECAISHTVTLTRDLQDSPRRVVGISRYRLHRSDSTVSPSSTHHIISRLDRLFSHHRITRSRKFSVPNKMQNVIIITTNSISQQTFSHRCSTIPTLLSCCSMVLSASFSREARCRDERIIDYEMPIGREALHI